MPEIIIFDGGLDGVKESYGGFLVLWGYNTIVSEVLHGLSVSSLEHHLELLPALLTGLFSLILMLRLP